MVFAWLITDWPASLERQKCEIILFGHHAYRIQWKTRVRVLASCPNQEEPAGARRGTQKKLSEKSEKSQVPVARLVTAAAGTSCRYKVRGSPGWKGPGWRVIHYR